MKKFLPLMMVLFLFASLMLAGCGGTEKTASEPASEPVQEPGSENESNLTQTGEPITMLFAAAASLEDSFVNTLIPMFNELYPWITVDGTYAASGKLQTQIEEGLEASVFMSAATKQMTELAEDGYIDAGSVVELLENEIVLIAPAGSDTTIASFGDVTKAASIAMGDPESVPAGQYAREALTSLGVYDAIQSKVSLGTDVTEVLNQVAEGSADVGFVYATDAAQKSDRVKILATAPEGSLEKKVIYPVGILAEAPQREAAELFLDFLQSPEAMAVFVENGFKSNL